MSGNIIDVQTSLDNLLLGVSKNKLKNYVIYYLNKRC